MIVIRKSSGSDFASWAIDFYRRNGFTVVLTDDKERLLRTCWSIPARQVETSVVLASARWLDEQGRPTATSDRFTA